MISILRKQGESGQGAVVNFENPLYTTPTTPAGVADAQNNVNSMNEARQAEAAELPTKVALSTETGAVGYSVDPPPYSEKEKKLDDLPDHSDDNGNIYSPMPTDDSGRDQNGGYAVPMSYGPGPTMPLSALDTSAPYDAPTPRYDYPPSSGVTNKAFDFDTDSKDISNTNRYDYPPSSRPNEDPCKDFDDPVYEELDGLPDRNSKA